jgi:ketosteroid isomerase-like protein
MSRNVELASQFTDALTAGEVLAELLAPDFRIENIKTLVTEKTYFGADGAREWIRDTFGPLTQGGRFQIDEIVAEGDDYLVTTVSLAGHGAASDAPIHMRWVNAWWFRDGKLTLVAGFRSRHEALEAVELAA